MVLPAEAEHGKIESQQRGHHVPDDGTGLTGMEEETKPEGGDQSAELARYEVHLQVKQTDSTSLVLQYIQVREGRPAHR